MSVDWPALLGRHRIDFTYGGQAGKGSIAVRCPFCGDADPSAHMAIMLHGYGWVCRRDQAHHKGRNPARLLAALLRISYSEAQALLGPIDFAYGEAPVAAPPPPLQLPGEFKSFRQMLPSARRFVRYLAGRGFQYELISSFTADYDIRYAVSGWFYGRIIFPAIVDGTLIGWTGRTIYPNEPLRYKSHGHLQLAWHDRLKRSDAHTLVLTEGPFDALKVAVLGREYGITATCFFTAAPSQAELVSLGLLAPRFKRIALLLDREAEGTAIGVSAQLAHLKVELLKLPRRCKDPAELDAATFLQLFAQS